MRGREPPHPDIVDIRSWSGRRQPDEGPIPLLRVMLGLQLELRPPVSPRAPLQPAKVGSDPATLTAATAKGGVTHGGVVDPRSCPREVFALPVT